ncbi:hypothetical protein A3A64_02785 [Candidatus Gottesmanbacteria bacterium RIFCSPLOWO2_01_FULL_48_11]|uniref:ComEC/Rec2-related protein domain-containing protein n=1 Tax=Candidatus Gottesmanbacteria bacterium RIFCSPLOWO2_01_FULL_48_11 TaxID=1798395 RepID=A0A1F6AS82_9BACT|nr:MAG: hypothetical protein A3A64_02785 [Candidatus Gottesmanbacteria bacterium RIFCSPLOWO2_01_FULL_48_11]
MVTVQTFTSIINQLLPEPHAGLLNGILFGTKATLSRELTDALITTGTLHIVALSGMNITILSGLVSKTLLWIVGRRVASVLTIALIAGFVWFVGASPSIVRAGIMGGISLIAIIFGKQYWGLLTWALAVGIMLLINPNWISDISFQLSAGATLGIILFGGAPAGVDSGKPFFGDVRRLRSASSKATPSSLREAQHMKELERSVKQGGLGFGTPQNAYPRTALLVVAGVFWSLIRDNLYLTLAAQVFTIPLILWYFHRISLISPVANVLIGWIVPALTIAGLLMSILGWMFLPLGQVVAWGAWVGLQYLIMVVTLLSKIPLASIGGQ